MSKQPVRILTEEVLTLRANGWSLTRIARRFGVSKVSVFTYLKHRKPEHPELPKRITPPKGKCAICGEVRTLVADHCHSTGVDRDWLCNNCNCGLGHFKDNIASLQAAITYLEHYNKVNVAVQA